MLLEYLKGLKLHQDVESNWHNLDKRQFRDVVLRAQLDRRRCPRERAAIRDGIHVNPSTVSHRQ